MTVWIPRLNTRQNCCESCHRMTCVRDHLGFSVCEQCVPHTTSCRAGMTCVCHVGHGTWKQDA